jgi:hypothetical protein
MTPGPPARTTTAPAARVVVLGNGADVAAVARAVALRLTAAPRAAGVVATWSPAAVVDDRPPAPGLTPPRAGAARLAAALADGGHAARAGGRLVHVRLEAGSHAVAEAERVQDAAGDVPAVIALGGARGSEWDDLLAQQDLVLLAVGPGVPPALAAVALARAQDLCGRVPAHAVTVGGGRRPRPSPEQLSAALGRLAAG